MGDEGTSWEASRKAANRFIAELPAGVGGSCWHVNVNSVLSAEGALAQLERLLTFLREPTYGIDVGVSSQYAEGAKRVAAGGSARSHVWATWTAAWSRRARCCR